MKIEEWLWVIFLLREWPTAKWDCILNVKWMVCNFSILCISQRSPSHKQIVIFAIYSSRTNQWMIIMQCDQKKLWTCLITFEVGKCYAEWIRKECENVHMMNFHILILNLFLWLMVLFLREPDKCMLPNPLLVILSTRIKLKSKRDILYFFFLPWTDLVCEIRSS